MQEDITSLSASPETGAVSLRQLDMQLVSLKRQVGGEVGHRQAES